MSTPQSDFTTTLQTASQSWQNFSLETKRPSIQQSITQAKVNNQQSLTTRKNLADTTKSFKKTVKQIEGILATKNNNNNGDAFSTECKSIVRSYQEEIDHLTKRCKTSESLVVDLYKGLNDVPDPTPLFNSAVDHLLSMEGQVQHLLKGMEEMQQEMERQASQSKKQIQDLEEEVSSYKMEIDTLKKDLVISEKKTIDAKKENQNAQSSNLLLSKEEKEELIDLRREVAEYELEFKTLKNQDITIKKLNAKIEELVANQEEVLQRELK